MCTFTSGMQFPTVIAVFGLPGSGKSFFAYHLADHLQAAYLNTDRIRNHLQKRGQYDPQDKQQVYHHLFAQMRQALRKDQKVVVDGTFYRHVLRQQLAAEAGQEGGIIRWIEVRADPALIHERLQQPRSDSEADWTVYELVKAQFEPLDTPHLVLHSTNDNLEKMLQETLKYLNDLP